MPHSRSFAALAVCIFLMVFASSCSSSVGTESSGGDADFAVEVDTEIVLEEPACPAGTSGCVCLPGNACAAGLECEGGICRELTCPEGSEGCPCYRNGSCDDGLFCNAKSICEEVIIVEDGDEELDPDPDPEPEIIPEEEAEAIVEEEQEAPNEINCEVQVNIDGGEPSDFLPNSLPEEEDVFSLGVMAGSMEKSAVILWSFTEDALSKTLRVWREDPDGAGLMLVRDKEVEPVEGFFKETVIGLSPKTTYNYAFFSKDESGLIGRSIIGRFTTAFPDNCLAPVTFGGTHGTNPDFVDDTQQTFKDLEMLSSMDMDFFLHLGDMSYSDSKAGLICYEKEEFLDRWRHTLTRHGYKELLASTGLYNVIDDHEVANDDIIEFENEDAGYTPEIVEIGHDAFYQMTPIEKQANGKYYRSYKWGKSLELFALDCRSERQPDTRDSDDPIYISKEQMAWLKQALSNSQAHFKVILNSVPISIFGPVLVAQNDRWEGYWNQREEILNYITDNNIQNIWWLTGDFHLGIVGRIEMNLPRSNMWEIMMGPSYSYNNPLAALVHNGTLDQSTVFPFPQFNFFRSSPATCRLSFNPIKDEVEVEFISVETQHTVYKDTLRYGFPQ